MTAWTGFVGWAVREQSAGDRLPYAGLIDERTVLLRDGSVMQCLHLAGFAFETADTVDLNHRQMVRDTALRAIADSRFVVHHHILRRRVDVALDGEFPDPISSQIDTRWRERLATRRLFVNDLFLSIVRRPAKGKIGLVEQVAGLFTRLDAASAAAAQAREIRELDAAREALTGALAGYSPRLLGGYPTLHGRCSEPLELLSALYNGEMRPMLAPRGDAGQHIPYRRISFGLEAIELKGAGGEKSFAALLALKEYPPTAFPGMLDALLRLPCEMALSESFSFLDRQTGVEKVATSLRRFRAADDDAASLKRGLAQAHDDLTSGRSALGEHQFSVLVRAPSLGDLDTAAADCVSALADLGAVAVREDLCLEPAFWAQFPGNESFGARRATVSTGAFASLASLHGFPIGRAAGNHWGPAISVLETTSATPYFFNFHNGDLGNFTVIGPSGSGKTVVLNFLTAQAQKLQPRTVFFDKDRGAEIFLRSLGGQYASIRPGEPTGFNPLRLIDSPSNRAFLRALIGRLVRPAVGELSAEEIATIAAAVDANFDQDPAFRRLRFLRELLSGQRRPTSGDLAARLAPWCADGEHAWLFDNDVDRLSLSRRVVGFDMTQLLDDPILRTPAMMYLFHRVEERLDGNPTLIVIDEGWKALDDEVFSARIRDWMKTLRKRNAVVGFGTQSASDALESRVASAIIEQAATQIFMPNPRAQADDYCTGFGLTEHELGLIRTLPAHAHCFLVKHGAHSVVARLDLSSMPDMLTVLSGREATVRKLDDLRGRRGDHPAGWWRELVGTEYPGPPAPVEPLRSVS